MITVAQVKATRKLLGWSIIDPASRSGVGRNVIASFEDQGRSPGAQFLDQIQGLSKEAGSSFPRVT